MNAIFPGEMKAAAAALMLLQYEQALAFGKELQSWWVCHCQERYNLLTDSTGVVSENVTLHL